MLDQLLDLFLVQIFGQSFVLMGIIVFIGYMAMKQKFAKSLSGAIKASIQTKGSESYSLISIFYLMCSIV